MNQKLFFVLIISDSDTKHFYRTIVGAVLLAVTLAGVLVLMLLKPTPWGAVSSQSKQHSPLDAFKSAWKFFITR